MIKGSNFTLDCIDLLHYKCPIINMNHGVSYIDVPDWTEKKQTTTTINPINKYDNTCIQYSSKLALTHQQIGKNPSKTIEN